MKRIPLFCLVVVSIAFAAPPLDPKVGPRASIKEAIQFHARLRPLNWGRFGEAGDFPPNDYPIEEGEPENQQETPEDFPGGVPPRDGHCVGVVEFRRMAHLAQVRGLPVPFKAPEKRVAYIVKSHTAVNLKIERAILKWQKESERWLGQRLLDPNLGPDERALYAKWIKDTATREGAIAFNAVGSSKQLIDYGSPFGALGARLYTTGLGGAQGHAVELFVAGAKAQIVDPNIGDIAVEPLFGPTGIYWKEPKGKVHHYGLAFGAPWKWIPMSAVLER